METYNEPTLPPYDERMRTLYSALCRREDLEAIAIYSVSVPVPGLGQTRGDFLGAPSLRKFVEIIPEGETWILKRVNPQGPTQSVYLKREDGFVVAIAVETGHPVIKSLHRMLKRTLSQLQGKTKPRRSRKSLSSQSCASTSSKPPPSSTSLPS